MPSCTNTSLVPKMLRGTMRSLGDDQIVGAVPPFAVQGKSMRLHIFYRSLQELTAHDRKVEQPGTANQFFEATQ